MEFVPPVSTTTSRGRTPTVLRTSCCCGVLLCSPSSRSPHPSWSVSCMKTPKRLPAPHWTVSLVSRIVIALFQVLQLEQITDSTTTLRKDIEL
ncbi:mCG118897, isoform CRA_a [Mus musculus]|nr:mCG118897, isoform CRA_a [Mus musculus]EDL15696.1 mCG118897, isoform CRA_a [Mus musculus]